MRIRLNLKPQTLLGRLGCPDLGPAEEEPLLGSKPIDLRRCRLGLQVIHQSSVGDVQTAEIANVLADRSLSLDLHTRQYFVAAELIDHACGTLVKLLAVLGRPPHVEIAFSVILTALIVETVRDLVTDHRSHSSVVNGIVSLEVEEGR